MNPPLKTAANRNWTVWVATGCGVGLVVRAPGTVGACWGIPLAWAVSHLAWSWQIVAVVALAAAGVLICQQAARRLGGKDPQAIVLDEIVSVPITFLFVPPSLILSWLVLPLGFALNRFFDITKLPPLGRLERLPGGLGIVADDCMAGIYSCVALHGLLWLQSLTGTP